MAMPLAAKDEAGKGLYQGPEWLMRFVPMVDDRQGSLPEEPWPEDFQNVQYRPFTNNQVKTGGG